MDDITAKRIESKLDQVLQYQQASRERMREIAEIVGGKLLRKDEQTEKLTDEAFRLRAALNDLIGAIINKKIEGLDEDLEEARAVLEAKE